MKHLKHQGGFTLIEILATMAIISIGFVAILQVFATSNTLTRESRNLTAASNFAQSQLDYYRSLGYANLSTGVTDVTSSLPSSLAGTAASCTSGSAKSACVEIQNGVTPVTVDATGNTGKFSTASIGSDGLPVIAYQDVTNKRLFVAKCGNTACSSGNTITTVDSN